jgi:hypothetical protein
MVAYVQKLIKTIEISTFIWSRTSVAYKNNQFSLNVHVLFIKPLVFYRLLLYVLLIKLMLFHYFYIPTYLPSYLPTYPPTYIHTYLPSCLPTYLLAKVDRGFLCILKSNVTIARLFTSRTALFRSCCCSMKRDRQWENVNQQDSPDLPPGAWWKKVPPTTITSTPRFCRPCPGGCGLASAYYEETVLDSDKWFSYCCHRCYQIHYMRSRTGTTRHGPNCTGRSYSKVADKLGGKKLPRPRQKPEPKS